jgi:hypothetical protein
MSPAEREAVEMVRRVASQMDFEARLHFVFVVRILEALGAEVRETGPRRLPGKPRRPRRRR